MECHEPLPCSRSFSQVGRYLYSVLSFLRSERGHETAQDRLDSGSPAAPRERRQYKIVVCSWKLHSWRYAEKFLAMNYQFLCTGWRTQPGWEWQVADVMFHFAGRYAGKARRFESYSRRTRERR